MNQANNITARVRQAVAEFANKEFSDADKLTDLGLDSLDNVELLIEIEDVFAIKLADDDWSAVKSTQDAIDLVTRLKLSAV